MDCMDYKIKLPFEKMAKWRRCKAVLDLKNEIYKQNLKFKRNALFFTYDYIDADNPNNSRLTWIDVYFPSQIYKDKRYFFNITTATYYMHEKFRDQIWNDIANETKDYSDINIYFEKHNDLYELKTTLDPRIDIYEYRTRHEEFEHRYDLILTENTNKYIMFENCHQNQSLRNYHWSIAYTAVLDVKFLTFNKINEFIKKFYDNKEVEWKDPFSIPQSHINYNKDYYKDDGLAIANALV